MQQSLRSMGLGVTGLHSLTIKVAVREQLNDLISFYGANSRKWLPTLDDDQLDEFVRDNRVCVVTKSSGEIVASAGVFPIGRGRTAASNDPVQIYELAGMAVSQCVGGLGPQTIQDILLAVRIVRLAIQEEGNLCLMSSVVNENEKSCSSLLRMGLVQSPQTPSWVGRLQRTWVSTTSASIAEFIAHNRAIDLAFDCVCASPVTLSRRNRITGAVESFSVNIELPNISVEMLKTVRGSVRPTWEESFPPTRVSKILPEISF